MKYFIWASPHEPTVQQKAELREGGILLYLEEIAPSVFNKIISLQFNSDFSEIIKELLAVVSSYEDVVLVQPAGSPALQFYLGSKKINLPVWYSFSERASADLPQPDGSVRKVSVFRHKGWVKL